MITNIPKNAGQRATYTLSIPPLGTPMLNAVVTTVIVQFPSTGDFPRDLGTFLSCGVFVTSLNSKTFLSYKGLLDLPKSSAKLASSAYTAVTCTISDIYTLKIDVSTINQSIAGVITTASPLSQSASQWQHFVITGVANPEKYNSAGVFKVSYFNVNTLNWQLSSALVYSISKAP